MMDFETWLKEYGPQASYIDEVDFLACWQAAQSAERDRIMKSLYSALMLRSGIPSEALLLARAAIAKYEGEK